MGGRRSHFRQQRSSVAGTVTFGVVCALGFSPRKVPFYVGSVIPECGSRSQRAGDIYWTDPMDADHAEHDGHHYALPAADRRVTITLPY